MKINYSPFLHLTSWVLILPLCSHVLAQSKNDDEDDHKSRDRSLPSLVRNLAVLEELVSAQSKQIAMLKRALNVEVQARVDGQTAVFLAASNYADLRISAEAADREMGDASLQIIAADHSNRIDFLTRALETERHARIEADAAGLTTSSSYTDQRIVTEEGARQAADAGLQAQITSIQPSPFLASEVATLRSLASIVNVAQSRVTIASNVSVEGQLGIACGHTLFVNRIQPVGGDCSADPAGITLFQGNVGVVGSKTLSLSRIEPINSEIFPRNGCELKIGDGLINGCFPGNCGGCSGNGLPTVFLSPVLFGR